jgi:hypothetical protein
LDLQRNNNRRPGEKRAKGENEIKPRFLTLYDGFTIDKYTKSWHKSENQTFVGVRFQTFFNKRDVLAKC